MRFAKILRFGGSRTDVGVDLYNLFNSNVTTAYQQTYQYRHERRRVAHAHRDRGTAPRAHPRDVHVLTL